MSFGRVESQELVFRMKQEPAKSFQDLIFWNKAHKLVLEVSLFSNCFSKTEMYGLTSQLRRASVICICTS